jgi:hypothetical protein
VGLEDRELLPVFDADSPFEIEAVGDIVTVLLPLKVEEGVMEGELVLLDVGVPLEVGEEVVGGVEDAEKETLPDLLGETPWVREGVGDAEMVELAERVVLGVTEAVPLPLCVPVLVGEGVGVGGGVTLPVFELLAVLLGLTPLVKEEVGDEEMVVLCDTVVLGVCEAVPLPVLLEDGVGVPVALSLPLLLGVTPVVNEEVGLGEIVEVPEGRVDVVGEGVADCD